MNYLAMLVNIVKKDKFGNGKHKSIKKCDNQIVEILAKSKSQNFLKFKSKILYKSKKTQTTNTIKESNFLNLYNNRAFTKLRQAFI